MKKQYLTPLMKVVNVQNAQIICGSLQSTSSNESYDEVSDEVTKGWY